MFVQIIRGHFDFSPAPTLSAGAKDLVSRLLRTSPDERLSTREVLNHKWLRAHAPSPPHTLGLLGVVLEPSCPQLLGQMRAEFGVDMRALHASLRRGERSAATAVFWLMRQRELRRGTIQRYAPLVPRPPAQPPASARRRPVPAYLSAAAKPSASQAENKVTSIKKNKMHAVASHPIGSLRFDALSLEGTAATMSARGSGNRHGSTNSNRHGGTDCGGTDCGGTNGASSNGGSSNGGSSNGGITDGGRINGGRANGGSTNGGSNGNDVAARSSRRPRLREAVPQSSRIPREDLISQLRSHVPKSSGALTERRQVSHTSLPREDLISQLRSHVPKSSGALTERRQVCHTSLPREDLISKLRSHVPKSSGALTERRQVSHTSLPQVSHTSLAHKSRTRLSHFSHKSLTRLSQVSQVARKSSHHVRRLCLSLDLTRCLFSIPHNQGFAHATAADTESRWPAA